MADEDDRTFMFKDYETSPDTFYDYTSSIRDHSVPLIIDNGGHQCRAGWAMDNKPRLIFRNLVAKARSKKEGDSAGNSYSVGNDIGNLEMVRWALRSQFDRDVVTHYECQAMSELLFECYNVPSVAYGIDSLFSLYNNIPNSDKTTALIVSSSCNVSHVLPVVKGRLDASNCKRINLGGAHATWYMQRLLQLKHPHHTQQITLSRAQELVHGYTSMAIDYSNELEKWASTDYYDDHVNKIQLPYAQVQAPQNSSTKNEEKEKMRRQKQGRRLQEINARRREEKLAEEEERLQDLMNIQALELENKNEFQRSFTEAGFQNAEALQAAIKNLTASIRKRKEKIVAMQTALELDSEVKEKDDIIDVVSDQPITESKKRQRTPKGAAEDKSAKKLKEDKKQLQQKSHEELQREETFKSWLTGLHKRRKEILDARQQRAQRREDLASRRSHASLERMRLLSQLAYDPNVRDDGTTRITNKKPKEDTFGQNDEDWMVYRSINKDAGDSDSEKEQEELNELENLLKKHDPDFSKRFGGKPETAVDWAEYYQLHLGVERIRVPEIVYQPSMLGIEQAGISETIDFILNHFHAELQTALVQNIFVTGGNTQFPKFQERLERELLAIRPFQSTFRVTTAANPALDAWCGARKWARSMSGNLKTVSVTRQEYEEKGGEYLKEHFASNLYVPTPSLS
ncbi:PREDICTED: actin-related protein 5-like [Acropora digitifera]|uniref:actin-related protein 5-like n=1 Tax=Acropora digitifera TaxID=70779 RepID=UPI00077A0706|nr:PREDICTED: actin-related protein 5-like [Acropora digitifera]